MAINKIKRISFLVFLLICFTVRINSQLITLNDGEVSVVGELKKWHKVTIAMGGPLTSETASPNPALDYKLTGVFTNGTSTFIIPGYFAADGDAANTSASSGNIWKIHFTPPSTGVWNYTIHFRSGANSAIETSITTGTAVIPLDGKTGTFTIGPSDKTGVDLRAKGRLQYVGEHFLRFQETGEWFLKAGPDSPENLLAYEDIDNTPNNGSRRKSYTPHAIDYVSGDPSWGANKGTELIGAINYLASKGLNSISFLTNNIIGDDRNVFPYLTDTNFKQFDCSKLDQWEVIFSHAESKGFHLHFKTQETENELLLDGGNVGVDRKLYYRQLIARFGHHLALNWNLGEENSDQTTAQRIAMAQYFYDNDPYKHNVVIHTYPGAQNAIYTPLLGTASKLTGVSIQTSWNSVHDRTIEWVNKSNTAGKKWVVANDEQGSASVGVPNDTYTGTPNLNDIRQQTLWGNIMGGGAGVEYYFGYSLPHSDVSLQDFRSRDLSWSYCKIALDFFKNHLPYWEMKNNNALTTGTNTYTLAKAGEVYAVYLRSGGAATLNLAGHNGTYTVQWYDPRNGGALQNGSITSIVGGGSSSLGTPPNSPTSDWVVLVKNNTTINPCANNSLPNISLATSSITGVAPASVTLNAIASDANGSITKVDFYQGNTLISTDITAPYSFTVSNLSEGSYSFTARATDNCLAEAISSSVGFNSTQPIPTYQISLAANNADAGMVSGAGTFAENQQITVSATATAGYRFDNWTENGNVVSTALNYSFTVTQARSLVANFTLLPTYQISLAANNDAGGTVSGGGTFAENQQITVSATAAAGYRFDNWTENGNVVSTALNYTFTVTQARSLVANFTLLPTYQISLAANNDAGGTVSGGGTFPENQQITAVATVASGYRFDNWTENGNVVSTALNYTFTVTQARSLVANFTLIPTYQISLAANNDAGGTVSGGGTFPENQQITAVASVAAGYRFDNWTENGNVVSTALNYTFTVTQTRSLVANFMLLPCNSTISATSNTLCAGTSLVLTATSGASYQWFKDDVQVGTQSTFTATAAGTYKVIVTNSFGCIATSPNFVITNANCPSISFSSPLNNANTGKSINVTVVNNNASLPLSNIVLFLDGVRVRQENVAPYAWNPTQDPVLGNLTSGSHILRAVATTTTGQIVETSITINVLNTTPTCLVTAMANGCTNSTVTITGTNSCGNSVTLRANPASGCSFTNWTENGSIVATSSSYSFSVTQNRSLVANFSLLPCTASITAPSTSFCTGSSLVLTASAGATYQWFRDNVQVGTQRTFTATLAGTYKVVVTNVAGCIATSANFIATTTNCSGPSISFSNPLNNANTGRNIVVTVINNNLSIALSNVILYLDGIIVRQESVAPYVWNSTNGGSLDPKLNNLSLGSHQLRAVATATNGQKAEATITINVVSAYSTRALPLESSKNDDDILVYPIPFQNNLTIETSMDNPIISVDLFDLTGKSIEILPKRHGLSKIDLSDNLPVGMFFLKIVSKNKTILRKIIKDI